MLLLTVNTQGSAYALIKLYLLLVEEQHFSESCMPICIKFLHTFRWSKIKNSKPVCGDLPPPLLSVRDPLVSWDLALQTDVWNKNKEYHVTRLLSLDVWVTRCITPTATDSLSL